MSAPPVFPIVGDRPRSFWKNHPGFRQVLLLAAIFFSVTLVLSVHRYLNLYATHDHGLFNQVFWNSIRGNWFQSTLSAGFSTAVEQGAAPDVRYVHLGQHFVIDFLLWMPLYALFPFPLTLTVLQVVLMTAGGLVLYPLARHYLSVPLSLMIVASYYGANTIIGTTLDNFYEFCQLPLFLFSAFLAFEKKWWWLFWVMVALTLGVREEIGISLFGFGAYLALSRRAVRLGIGLCVLSFVYVVIVTTQIMPLFSPDNSMLYLGKYFDRFVDKPDPSTLEVLWAILSQPQAIAEIVFSDFNRRLRYILGLWLPLAFVPAIAPAAWAMGFPYLFTLLIQMGNNIALSINTRYVLAIAPGLYYGAILWWARHPNAFRPRFRRIWIGCIILSLIFTITSNPHRSLYFLTPYRLHPLLYHWVGDRWHHSAQVFGVMGQIPPDASISTNTYSLPHLSGRRAIVRIPKVEFMGDSREIVTVEYLLLDFWHFKQPTLVSPLDGGRFKEVIPVVDRLLERNTHGIATLQGEILLLKQGVTSSPEDLSRWAALRNQLKEIS